VRAASKLTEVLVQARATPDVVPLFSQDFALHKNRTSHVSPNIK
jgi:hypothetical protein